MARISEGGRLGADAGHEMVDHLSEVTVRLHAPSFPALIAEATRAFGELVPREAREGKPLESREFQLEGGDRAAALVGWLNEMVYLGEIEEWLPVRVRRAEENGTSLRILAQGVRLDRPFVLVKAATLHRARVEEGPGGLRAEVTLDV